MLLYKFVYLHMNIQIKTTQTLLYIGIAKYVIHVFNHLNKSIKYKVTNI